MAAHGVPQRLLSDNGVAINRHVAAGSANSCPHVAALGVEAITGKPYLDEQPLAVTLMRRQAQVDAFDHIYNTQRPHQGLPGRITPLAASEAPPKTDHPARTRLARLPAVRPGPPAPANPPAHACER